MTHYALYSELCIILENVNTDIIIIEIIWSVLVYILEMVNTFLKWKKEDKQKRKKMTYILMKYVHLSGRIFMTQIKSVIDRSSLNPKTSKELEDPEELFSYKYKAL